MYIKFEGTRGSKFVLNQEAGVVIVEQSAKCLGALLDDAVAFGVHLSTFVGIKTDTLDFRDKEGWPLRNFSACHKATT